MIAAVGVGAMSATIGEQAAPGKGIGLLGALLGGMLSGPAVGDELGEAFHRPAGFDLADDVDEVAVGLDAEREAIVDEGEGDGEALAAARGASEEEVPSCDGEESNSAFDAPVVYLKASVVEPTMLDPSTSERVATAIGSSRSVV